ncbi:YidB family protein [Rhizosaccharibacter radicis]|uniref:YidB family protein n=1 Tax=Rhizosaccharibacter radicis TaxID=2782605 RepID=A0ABT1VTW7_9PROT|nr:YidB family protein [Acetobacteraceae bacterium KSS12]
MSGILGNLGGLLGGLVGQEQHGAAGGLLDHALGAAGGIPGILDRLEQAGMGDKARSWISAHDGNLPISPEEVSRVFPPEQLDGWAQRFGLPAGTAAAVLSHLLPRAVDQATPNGQVTDAAPATTRDAEDQAFTDDAPAPAAAPRGASGDGSQGGPDLSGMMGRILDGR